MRRNLYFLIGGYRLFLRRFLLNFFNFAAFFRLLRLFFELFPLAKALIYNSLLSLCGFFTECLTPSQLLNFLLNLSLTELLSIKFFHNFTPFPVATQNVFCGRQPNPQHFGRFRDIVFLDAHHLEEHQACLNCIKVYIEGNHGVVVRLFDVLKRARIEGFVLTSLVDRHLYVYIIKMEEQLGILIPHLFRFSLRALVRTL